MIWKVIIASEVLTVPTFGVGSKMSLAQVNLETAQVISWTIIAILLTALSDLLFSIFLKETTRYRNRKNFQKLGSLYGNRFAIQSIPYTTGLCIGS